MDKAKLLKHIEECIEQPAHLDLVPSHYVKTYELHRIADALEAIAKYMPSTPNPED